MLIAVFDGHGREGHLAAARVRTVVMHWVPRLTALASQPELLQEPLETLFAEAHETLEREGLAHYAGTTATVAVVDLNGGMATVAHVGDSTLVVMSDSKVDAATVDHRVDRFVERRVLAHGGEVRTSGSDSVRRIYAPGSDFPGLSMARALGDSEAQCLGARCQPEISHLRFRSGSTLVVASDGVWDVVPAADAATQLAQIGGQQGFAVQNAGTLAQALVAEARRRYADGGDVDDITAVVVRADSEPEVADTRRLLSLPQTESLPGGVFGTASLRAGLGPSCFSRTSRSTAPLQSSRVLAQL
jgi:serine/threonine protein phosphatase PrpC